MQQLELNLWEQIRKAEAEPTAIAFEQLLLCFDQELERMSAKQKLEHGAEVIQQLAELLAMRAESYFEEWQQRYDPTGPAIDDFSDLMRQSFSLELDDLIEEPEPSYRLPSETNVETSLVSEMSKDDLLELLEDSAVNSRSLDIEKLEGDEDVGAWIRLIQEFLVQRSDEEALFTELIGHLPRGKAWLAVLLGGFHLEQSGDFYEGVVRVRSRG